MKHIHKDIVTGLIIAAMTAGAPFAAFAEGSNISAKAKGDFCTAIQSADFNALAKLDDRMSKKDAKRGQKDEKIAEMRTEIDAKRAEGMKKFAGKEADREARIPTVGLTDAQKSALVQAQAGVAAAVDTKTGDLSQLVSEYRASMDKIRSEHRTQVDALVAQVKTDTDAAVAKAKADCASGVSSQTAKANFQAAIKAIHDKLRIDQQSLQAAAKVQVDSTVAARKESGTEVRHSFRDSVKSAWGSFKSLFGNK